MASEDTLWQVAPKDGDAWVLRWFGQTLPRPGEEPQAPVVPFAKDQAALAPAAAPVTP